MGSGGGERTKGEVTYPLGKFQWPGWMGHFIEGVGWMTSVGYAVIERKGRGVVKGCRERRMGE